MAARTFNVAPSVSQAWDWHKQNMGSGGVSIGGRLEKKRYRGTVRSGLELEKLKGCAQDVDGSC